MAINKIDMTDPEGTVEVMPRPKKILKGRPHYFALVDKDEQSDRPYYLMMNVETTCGYNCPKCALSPVRDDACGDAEVKPHLTLAERTAILHTSKLAGIRCLVIAGLGEPTSNFDFIKPLVEAAYAEGLTTILFSTLSDLTPEQALFYRDHDVSVIISLDSLERKKYRKLTGRGQLADVLSNIDLLRTTYASTTSMIGDTKIVRLGINTTIVQDNMHQLDAMRAFAGDDMQFVCNPPMRMGTFDNAGLWEKLVGDSWEAITKLAAEKSETGGNSTRTTEGVCGYFINGISIDTHGKVMTCAYASESTGVLDRQFDPRNPDAITAHIRKIQALYRMFSQNLGHTAPCPVRDPHFGDFLAYCKNSDVERTAEVALEQCLATLTDGIKNHPILKQIADGKISQKRLHQYLSARLGCAGKFLDLLESGIKAMEASGYDDLASELGHNMDDETGKHSDKTDYGSLSHDVWRRDLLAAMPFTIPDESQNQAVRKYNAEIEKIIESMDAFVIIGAILAIEHSIPEEFSEIWKGLKISFPEIFGEAKDEHRQASMYILHHMGHDQKHAKDLMKVLKPYLNNPEILRKIMEGAKAIERGKLCFYDDFS